MEICQACREKHADYARQIGLGLVRAVSSSGSGALQVCSFVNLLEHGRKLNESLACYLRQPIIIS